jgi:hypothetical protein
MEKVIVLFKRFYPVLIGAVGGYFYYYFIGCANGSCPITGNPIISTFYGAIMGSVFVFGKQKNKNKQE